MISATQVSDLTPLSTSKLKSLEMRATQIQELNALAGLPITRLVLPGSPVTNLEPLRNCPLKELNAIGLQLESLSPLNSMPLESLALSLDGRDEDDFSLLKSIGLKRLRSPNDPLNQTAEEFFIKHKPEIRED